MADPRRTILLARPGTARERLRSALEQAGIEVVLEADPLETGIDEVRAVAARNLVIAVDAEVEDALERFDPLLADDGYRILFEEVALVDAREGWDAARWSRHLGAKLLGHGDVLPLGHEPDDVTSDDEFLQGTAESFDPQLEKMSAQDESVEQSEAESADAALPEPAVDVALDWTRFQDFEAVNELPAANAPQAADTHFRAALASLEQSELPEEQAYEQLEEEMARFDAQAPNDRWQDFERVQEDAVDSETIATASSMPPEAPSWSLTDEPLPLETDAGDGKNDDGLAGLDERIAGLTLVDDELGTTGEGAVLLVGGIGGPDPLRQILQQLDSDFGVPVLVQQWLDGGQYDRLVRQMDRASRMPVQLAAAGRTLQPGHVYVVPAAVGVQRQSDGALHFIKADTRGFADLLAALPPGSSGLVLLSGASGDVVEPAQRFQQAGGRVFAQAAEGCYDHAVPAFLIQRGAEAHLPAALATQLAARWQPQVSA